MTDPLERSSLHYHRVAPAGKLAVSATKPLANQMDLSQAYSPGVAFPCMKIKEDPSQAAVYTTRGNLVAVINIHGREAAFAGLIRASCPQPCGPTPAASSKIAPGDFVNALARLLCCASCQ